MKVKDAHAGTFCQLGKYFCSFTFTTFLHGETPDFSEKHKFFRVNLLHGNSLQPILIDPVVLTKMAIFVTQHYV